MESLSRGQLEKEADAFDAAAYQTPGIDGFCSSLDWILPSIDTWGGDMTSVFWRGDHGYAAMLRHEDGAAGFLGCDAMWGFACPVVGSEPRVVAEEFFDECRRRRDEWDMLLLTGLAEDARLFQELVKQFVPHYELRRGSVARRWTASLEGGLDGYLGRRSAKLRSNLRRALRRAREAGVEVEEADGLEVEEIFDRVLGIEQRSWKGLAGTGLLSAEMQAFYRRIAVRCSPRGRLRVLFARRDGEDVGYILGAVRGGTYRGFQFSFDRRCEGLSIGSLLQYAQLERLCEAGVETYDLGIDLPYKRRWADEPFDTLTVVVM